MSERDTFPEFDKDINEAWLYKLRSSFWKIQNIVRKNSQKELNEVCFVIEHGMKDHRIGEWRPSTRTIAFEIDLLRNYEWAAVEHVMKHEVAHQIVNEILGISAYGHPHGEAWKIACKMVEIDDGFDEDNPVPLSSYKGSMESPMVERIRKLLIHGNDKACTESEAELFLTKAQELMIRHQIKMVEVCGTERFFVSRPVGPKFKRFPSWLWTMVHLVTEHYHVKAISMNCGGFKYGKEYRIEFFGQPDNLDIAEYVYHALLNQGERMFKDFMAEHTLKCKTDPDYLKQFTNYGYRNRMSRASYLLGLFNGYARKLELEKVAVESKIEIEDGAIVPMEDALLGEMFENYYHPHNGKVNTTLRNAAAYSAGRAAGASMTLAKGVRSGGYNGRLLS